MGRLFTGQAEFWNFRDCTQTKIEHAIRIVNLFFKLLS